VNLNEGGDWKFWLVSWLMVPGELGSVTELCR
jgi:hypothetical protein